MKSIRSQLLALVLALLLSLTISRPGAAADDASYSVWSYSFYKDITYEVLARGADIPIYYFVSGGGASSLAFTVANVASGVAVFYLFEVAWNFYGPTIEDRPGSEVVEIEAQKTILYRVVAAARKLGLGYVFTGSGAAGLRFAVISNVVSAAIYAVNEYGWYTYGPPVDRGQPVDRGKKEPPPVPQSPDLGTEAVAVAKNGAAYLSDLAAAEGGRLAGDITTAISELRQRL